MRFPGLEELALAGGLAYAVVGVFGLVLGWPGRARRAALAGVIGVVAATPWVVEARFPFHRLLAAVWAVMLGAKAFDLHVGAGRGERPGLGAVLAFLPNPASVVLRKARDEPRPGRGDDLRRLALSGAGLVAGLVLFVGCFLVDWGRWPFALEHSAKVAAFFLALIPGAGAFASALRLLGGFAREPMANPIAAATPAEFWRRYNRPAQQFFAEDVFKLCGGLRAPVAAGLATFAVSALVHEYIFAIATGRARGYQTAFFLAQGVAALATMRVARRGWRRAPWVAGTLAFNLATAFLFFACVNDVVPFYQPRPDGEARPPAPTAPRATAPFFLYFLDTRNRASKSVSRT